MTTNWPGYTPEAQAYEERTRGYKTLADVERQVQLTVVSLFADEGTVVVFEGRTEAGERQLFAADHRSAQAIADALHMGEEPVVEVDLWQLVGQPWRGPDEA